MRYPKPGWMLCAIIAACIGIMESARAQDVLYTWSDSGWNGGGEVTGSFIINDSYPTTTGLLGASALVSFQAQWSGNIYSQPYTWTSLSSVEITWNPQGNGLLSLQLDPGGGGPVEYLEQGFIIDYRPGAIDPPGFGFAQYENTGGPFTSSVVILPEPGITQIFLGLALPVLLLRRWRRVNFSCARGSRSTVREHSH